jgi:hypothetical protein
LLILRTRTVFALAIFASLVGLTPSMAVAAEGGCDRNSQKIGTCAGVEAAVGDSGVDVSAGWEETTPGSEAGGDRGDVGFGGGQSNGNAVGNSYGNSDGGGGDGLPEGVSFVPGEDGIDSGDAASGPGQPTRRFDDPVPVPVVPADPAAPACVPQTPCDPALVVRVRDLVSIEADQPVQGMEPNGWLVVGIPTSFYASAAVHQSAGPLLGSPAEVRFTPVGYTWDYGDGTSGSSASGGASWAAQGLPEFSETTTSHVYESTGTLTIGLSVAYAAEYRFAGGAWRSVEGLLEVPASPMTAIADRAGTVLVAEACSANPGGPGC